jgi:hypothetical protein
VCGPFAGDTPHPLSDPQWASPEGRMIVLVGCSPLAIGVRLLERARAGVA